jgi:hypothetical protein
VPSFPLKAFEIVSDPSNHEYVRWNDEGDAFIITNKNAFSDQVLPKYFKHKNLSTFIRQLNIYGFKKTKYKDEEHCFAHKDFKRQNKRLLLNMKRRAKNRSSDKKSTSSESGYMSRSEVMLLFEKMTTRIDEQDNKIDKLIQANKEFKNSVLALYTQLEKSKEREKRMEKILMDHQLSIGQGSSNTLLDSDMFNNRGADNMFRLSNSEMFNLFSSFMKNFIQQIGKNDINNIYIDKNNKLGYYPRSPGQNKSQEVLPINGSDIRYNMIENGPLSS